MNSNSKIVTVISPTGTKNAGDAFLTFTARALIRETIKSSELDTEIRVFDFFSHSFDDLGGSSDETFILLGGGVIWSGNQRSNLQLEKLLEMVKRVRNEGSKFYILGVGVNNFHNNAIEAKLALTTRELIKRAEFVYVRDWFSVAALDDINPGRKIFQAPCPSSAYSSLERVSSKIGADKDNQWLVLSLATDRLGERNGGYEFFIKTCEEVARSCAHLNIAVLANNPEDSLAHEVLRSFGVDSISLMPRQGDWRYLPRVIGRSRYLITSRGHSQIAGFSTATATISLATHPKISSFAESELGGVYVDPMEPAALAELIKNFALLTPSEEQRTERVFQIRNLYDKLVEEVLEQLYA